MKTCSRCGEAHYLADMQVGRCAIISRSGRSLSRGEDYGIILQKLNRFVYIFTHVLAVGPAQRGNSTLLHLLTLIMPFCRKISITCNNTIRKRSSTYIIPFLNYTCVNACSCTFNHTHPLVPPAPVFLCRAVAPGIASPAMARPYFLKSRSVKFVKKVVLARKFIPTVIKHSAS